MIREWLSLLRSAVGGSEQDFTTGNLPRGILLLAVPMVLEMGMESVFAVADVFFVARLGSEAVAAVGLSEALLVIVYALGIGVGAPTTAMVARRIGEKDPEAAAAAAVQANVVGITMAVLIGVPGAVFAPSLLALLGGSPEVVAVGSGYASLLLASNAVIMLLFLNGAVLRGAGDAPEAMRALWIANGINLVLDPCLLFGLGPFPELGLVGAAVATTIGRGVGVSYQWVRMWRGTRRLQVRRRHLRLRPRIVLELLRLALGGVGQILVETASWLLLVRVVAIFGSAAVAGYTIAMRVVMFALMPGWGLANAAATLVGQNLGADKPARAERAVWMTGCFNMGFLGLFGAVFVLFPSTIIAVFTDDAAVLAAGADCLHVVAYGYVLYGWGMVMTEAFNGAGDTLTPLGINVVCFWFLKLPLAFLLARVLGWGPHGVWVSVTVAYCVNALIGLLLFRRGTWKSRKV